MSTATVTIEGKRFVILPENEYEHLRSGQKPIGLNLPPLPKRLPDGNYPAVAYSRAVTARDIITARSRLGLSQIDLANRAGIRVETLNRIERAKMTPTVATMQKIDRVLSKLEASE
jgi:DNA-binding XRE family transcriptional regulator